MSLKIYENEIRKLVKERGLAGELIGYSELKDPNILELLFKRADNPSDEPTSGGTWCYFIEEKTIDTVTMEELLELWYSNLREHEVFFDSYTPEKGMKILVLKSSGNINGSSNLLADDFILGAEYNHEIIEYDVIRKDIRPCLGCNACGMNGPCVQKDDFENELKSLMKAADMLVFVMPVYYYNWPSQLKTVVDRFYSFTGELTRMHKKTALISVAWDDSDTVFEVVEAYYKRICEYMQFEDCGSVLGKGCGTPEMTLKTEYPQKAFQLGRSLK